MSTLEKDAVLFNQLVNNNFRAETVENMFENKKYLNREFPDVQIDADARYYTFYVPVDKASQIDIFAKKYDIKHCKLEDHGTIHSATHERLLSGSILIGADEADSKSSVFCELAGEIASKARSEERIKAILEKVQKQETKQKKASPRLSDNKQR